MIDDDLDDDDDDLWQYTTDDDDSSSSTSLCADGWSIILFLLWPWMPSIIDAMDTLPVICGGDEGRERQEKRTSFHINQQ